MIKQFLWAFKALRPKQWTKNLLLFVAPFAADDWGENFLHSALGFLSFCLAASVGYILNDINDLEHDKRHPKKRFRPFASGALSVRSGASLSIFCLIILGFLLLNLPSKFNFILIFYMLNTFLYTKFIKNIPVIELFSVTFGFILRLVAGGLVIEVPISKWFLIVGGFGALFLVSSKRLAERRLYNSDNTRKVIDKYSLEFLHSSTSISGAVAVIGYCLWAFGQPIQRFWFELSVIPLVMGLFRYNWMAQGEVVEAPEDAIWGDATLRVLGAGLLLTLTVAIYL